MYILKRRLVSFYESISTTKVGGKRIFHPQFVSRNLEIDLITNFLALSPVEAVIDYGCGPGPFKYLLPDKWIGVDMENNKNVDILVNENEFPKNLTYSHFLCTSVLEHVRDIDEFLISFDQNVADGTLCLFTVPFMVYEHGTPHDYRRITVEGLLKLFTKYEILTTHKMYGAGFCIANLINNQIDIFCRSHKVMRKIYFVCLPFLSIIYLINNIQGLILDKMLGKRKSNVIYNSSAILFKK